MGDLRKEVAHAITGHDLSSEDLFESALDKLYAFAYSDPLGIALWRLKWANDAKLYHPAVLLLAHRIKRRHEPQDFRRRIAQVAIEEWLYDLCPACGGRGHSVVEGTPHAHASCNPCNGSGRKRPSEKERMLHASMRPEIYRKMERLFARAHNKIDAADALTWNEMAAHLGRRGAMKSDVRFFLANIKERRQNNFVLPPPHNENDMAESRETSRAAP